ncbi:hypothetical protein B9T25_07480 [Acinetobacter sp. ANC 4470]|uniref:hypothetical protein n=1 Tax=Acinetobacter sp. ANC 4470 TaxID=1977881 RepID=UPI000A354ABC|nr:hypothetical protein [Acinetobacter sp. ANC 4470]OTG67817.1 hypothetical protein B9T25_07480 [Acinetobacter sp. ANC 4470]
MHKLYVITHARILEAVVWDDKPVYVHDDGKKFHLITATVATISRLNGEVKAHQKMVMCI